MTPLIRLESCSLGIVQYICSTKELFRKLFYHFYNIWQETILPFYMSFNLVIEGKQLFLVVYFCVFDLIPFQEKSVFFLRGRLRWLLRPHFAGYMKGEEFDVTCWVQTEGMVSQQTHNDLSQGQLLFHQLCLLSVTSFFLSSRNAKTFNMHVDKLLEISVASTISNH